MSRVLILGSGPAAAGAALALSNEPDVEITVIDVGVRLEQARRAAVDDMATAEPADWDAASIRLIAEQPMDPQAGPIPQKRSYGSDFPFRDLGQLDGISADQGANTSVVSAAYGGFSNVWGAQLMPFAASVFERWPVSMNDMERHYRAVLSEVPFAAEEDDLAKLFPLIGAPVPLPAPSTRTRRVLDSYARHRSRLNRLGVAVGRARLAFAATACVRCGLCMTGCPYSLIYSASQTFDRLRQSGRVTYHAGLLAVHLEEEGHQARVTARELATGRMHRFEADRVFVACGGMGSTRLVAGSLQLFDRELHMAESRQFALPFISGRSVPDPRHEPQFTLNQFNLTVAFDEIGYDLSQLHFYTYNPLFSDAMPAPLRARPAEPARRELLRRLSFALGYLPSWMSPPLSVRIGRPQADAAMPELHVARLEGGTWQNPHMRRIVGRLLRSSPMLDLYPVLPMLRMAAAGKSYHYGGSFGHGTDGGGRLGSDRLGRVGGWQRIHLVDASVFPSVPATTFTLTVMANAHRIATEAVELGG
jgi:choline dehydrogenase-like flavoprotein